MNILYIGPYQNSFESGLASKSILRSLSLMSNTNIIARPVFISDFVDEQTEFSGLENKPITDIDIVLQHCPLNMASTIKVAGAKNYILPMMYNKNTDWSALQYFDRVITDDVKLSTEIYQYKPTLFKYEANLHPTNRFNLGMLNQTKKFYFVGEYLPNQHMIQKLLVAFNIAFRTHYDTSLTLFINDQSQHEKHLTELIMHTNHQLRINNMLPKIKMIFSNFSNEEVYIAHETGDIFIGLYDHPHNTYHRQMAENFGKTILDIDEITTIDVPAIDDVTYRHKMNKKSILTNSLIECLLETYQGKKAKSRYNHLPTITKIL